MCMVLPYSLALVDITFLLICTCLLHYLYTSNKYISSFTHYCTCSCLEGPPSCSGRSSVSISGRTHLQVGRHDHRQEPDWLGAIGAAARVCWGGRQRAARLAGIQSGVFAGARDQRRLHAMRPPARVSLLPGPIAERCEPRREPLPQPSRRAAATATTWLHRGTSAIGR
jgi:hypothetical protein